MGPLQIVLIVLGAIVLLAVSFFAGVTYRKRVGEREIALPKQKRPASSMRLSAAVKAVRRKCSLK